MSNRAAIGISPAKEKRPYRKGSPLSAAEKQSAAVARKRLTHRKVEIFVRNPIKDQLTELCDEDGLTQGQFVELLIEQEIKRRRC